MTPWVLRLLLANLAVYFFAPAQSVLWYRLALRPEAFLFQPWGILTYMFVHGDFGHLFFNMLGLFFFGRRLEMHLGGKSFLTLYFLSGLGGAVFSFIPPLAPVVGASGAVFGVLLGFAYFWPKEKIYIWMILPVQAWILVGVLAAVSLFSGVSSTGTGVAHFAHLGGFAAGYAYLRWRKRKYFQQWKPMATPKSQLTKAARRTGDGESLRRWRAIRVDGLHELNREEVKRILAKAEESGVGSLTFEERTMMDRFANPH